jgi:uncharacterized protein YgiM (DUF1202 family)
MGALVLLIASGMLVAPEAHAARRFVWVKTAHANVRQAPSPEAPILASPAFAERLLATGSAQDWVEVALDGGRTAYVWAGAVTTAHPESVWVEAASAAVLSRPLPGARRVAELTKGTELSCIGVGNGWDEVALPGGNGWVEATLVMSAPPNTLFVRAAAAMVHTEASADSDVAAEVPAGTALRELGDDRPFYHVALDNGQDGWVFEGELGRQPPYMVYVVNGKTSVYAERTFDSTVVAIVAGDEELSAFDEDDGFYLVRTADGTVGWMYRDDVIPIGGPPTP